MPKCRYFCAALRRKSPRFACRNPCAARLPEHLIPFEAGGCPLELPRPDAGGSDSAQVFDKLRRDGAPVGAPSLLFYSRTSTGPAMSSRSGWTAQSRASTCTPRPGGPAEGLAKLRVGTVVGLHPPHIPHLDHKAHRRLIAGLLGRHQLLQVLHPPEGGGVGEADHPVLLQGDPLHLHKAPAARGLPVEVKPGDAVFCLRPQQGQVRNPLSPPGPTPRTPGWGPGRPC